MSNSLKKIVIICASKFEDTKEVLESKKNIAIFRDFSIRF
jgi:hypothetical protein